MPETQDRRKETENKKKEKKELSRLSWISPCWRYTKFIPILNSVVHEHEHLIVSYILCAKLTPTKMQSLPLPLGLEKSRWNLVNKARLSQVFSILLKYWARSYSRAIIPLLRFPRLLANWHSFSSPRRLYRDSWSKGAGKTHLNSIRTMYKFRDGSRVSYLTGTW